ncbi:MAG: hypothetical protein RL748_1138, partial [Pseudomonadota bacterium]
MIATPVPAPAGDSSALISLRGITRRYGSGASELLALKGIDLEI